MSNNMERSDTHKVIVDIDETNCCHKRIIKFFKKIEAAIDTSIHSIVVVLDNAKYYRNKEVAKFLETSRIIPMFIPPYCPNLNLIERFWKFCKKHLVTNTYIKKYENFKNIVNDFFYNIEKYADELKSLITENFQIINYQGII